MPVISGDVAPFRSGTRQRNDGESWTNWWLFRGVLSDEQVEDFCAECDICRWYGGPGRPYQNAPVVRRSASYTLITQDGGWDI